MKCPKCGGEVMQQARVVVECPVSCRNLSKTGMRSRDVRILYAEWFNRIYCAGCAWIFASEREIHETPDTDSGTPATD